MRLIPATFEEWVCRSLPTALLLMCFSLFAGTPSLSPAAAEGAVELDDGGQFRLAQARQGQFSLE